MLRIRPVTFAATVTVMGSIAASALIWAGPSATQEQPTSPSEKKPTAKADPPADQDPVGDPKAGREVFRFETFGNEGFWTDAIRLPKGMEDEKFTPRQALEAGLHVDAEAVPADLATALSAELKTDLSPEKAPLINDPKVTMRLIKANAVIGVVPKGDKVGISCAICHTITDGFVFQMPGKGSVGKRLDGRATHSIDMGKLLALAANSRAYYPNLQLELGGKTTGRAPKGIRKDSTEAEVDAYLRDPAFYPRGTFDETQDGIGNPVQNTPLFRQDLAAPYGSNGLHESFEGISNASYTTNLDPTTLATPEGKKFLSTLGGKAGEEIHENYVQILKETGVTGYPFVKAEMAGKVGHRNTPVGRQVDQKKLLDMKAYTISLQAPPGEKADAGMVARGKAVFQASCATCHNVDPNAPVPSKVLALKEIWPGYAPAVVEKRKPPLLPIENSPGIFDDKMVVVDASERGAGRGVSLPLLLDLARKPRFLHDDSVPDLEALLDPKRGDKAPHPFYPADAAARSDVVAFLKALGPTAGGDRPAPKTEATPDATKPGPTPKGLPTIPQANPAAAELPPGYRAEVFLSGLEYPSSIEFDDRGRVYVAEAGTIDGDLVAPTRVRRATQSGPGSMLWETVADGLSAPVCDLLWHQGKLFIAHRGKVSVLDNGKVTDLVTGLPAFGDHHTNQLTVGPDGKVYFGQGTATNSGVVGIDNYLFGWLPMWPTSHDVPGYDIKLKGQAFETFDPFAALTKKELTRVKTGAFRPFGKVADAEQVVKGQAKATGAVLRMDADGKNLECFAWGFRNPFGVMWGPDGKLYASENGYDERGSRPVANSPDVLWEVKKGAWYGWPDFTAGEPVTDPKFKSKDGPQAEFLMVEHPKVEKPLGTFAPHSSVCKIEFDRTGAFGPKGAMYLAASGDYSPITAGNNDRVGYWVKRIDPVTGKGEDFFRAKKDALGPPPLEYVTTAGPRRPVDVKFGPDGSLYVVDIGPVHMVPSAQGPTPRPFPSTGVVWRISKIASGR